MASNDFIYELVKKLEEEKIEYLLVTVQKGKEQHSATAFFNIETIDGSDMILTTFEEVYDNLANSSSPEDGPNDEE